MTVTKGGVTDQESCVIGFAGNATLPKFECDLGEFYEGTGTTCTSCGNADCRRCVSEDVCIMCNYEVKNCNLDCSRLTLNPIHDYGYEGGARCVTTCESPNSILSYNREKTN